MFKKRAVSVSSDWTPLPLDTNGIAAVPGPQSGGAPAPLVGLSRVLDEFVPAPRTPPPAMRVTLLDSVLPWW